jgi:hypothetical protein
MPSVHPPAVLHELARRTEEAKGTKVVMSDAYGIGVGDPTVMVATPPRMWSRLPTGARWCFHLRGISPSPLLTRPAKIEARLEVTVKPRSGVASSSLPGGQRQRTGSGGGTEPQADNATRTEKGSSHGHFNQFQPTHGRHVRPTYGRRRPARRSRRIRRRPDTIRGYLERWIRGGRPRGPRLSHPQALGWKRPARCFSVDGDPTGVAGSRCGVTGTGASPPGAAGRRPQGDDRADGPRAAPPAAGASPPGRSV